MYSNQYGGFRLSKEANRENNRRKERNALLDEDFYLQTHDIDRHDPLMIQICSELREMVAEKYLMIAIELIPAKFANYYWIEVYDGQESVKIDYKQYQLDLLRSILTDESLADKSKISKALRVLGKGRTRFSTRKLV